MRKEERRRIDYPFTNISPSVFFRQCEQREEAKQRSADAILDGVHRQLREVTLKYGHFVEDLRFLRISGILLPDGSKTDVVLISEEMGGNTGLALRLRAFGETIRFDSDPGAKIYRDRSLLFGARRVDTISILGGKVTIDGARAVEKMAKQIIDLYPLGLRTPVVK